MQCFAQKFWVQASRWMPLHTQLTTNPNPNTVAAELPNCSGGPSRILANYSGTAWGTWQRTQGNNMVSRGGPNPMVHLWHMWGFWGSVFVLTGQGVNTGPLGVSCGVCCEMRPPLIRLMQQMLDYIGNLEASLTPEHFFVVWVGSIVRLGGSTSAIRECRCHEGMCFVCSVVWVGDLWVEVAWILAPKVSQQIIAF